MSVLSGRRCRHNTYLHAHDPTLSVYSVDTYASHERKLYCKVHHKMLFKPKAVEEKEEHRGESPAAIPASATHIRGRELYEVAIDKYQAIKLINRQQVHSGIIKLLCL